MQVTHPLADRDAPVPPAVACPDGQTRHPDSDGVVEAPEDVAVALADAWADCYGVPPDGLLAHGDEAADICGYQDETMDAPCQRDAGWGRDADTGRCKDHHDEEE
jgi:hypothetical protein